MPAKRKFKLDNFLEVLTIKSGLSTGVIARKVKCHISTALRYLRELKKARQVIEQRISNTINLWRLEVHFRLGELFSGPGGLALGALSSSLLTTEKHSITSVWANDCDSNACDTYRNNICPKNPECVICCDVSELDITKFSPIDALAFGFPCNDFSIVGEQKGLCGTYGALYSYGIKALKHFRPMWFFAENVGGLKSANEGKTFKLIMQEMIDAGYNITPHLYKFEEYGVPQARHRIIIIGIRKDIELSFKVPSITTPIPVTCREAIENPPISKNTTNNEYTNQSKQVVERLKHIKPGENAFTATLPDHLKLNVKGVKISSIYKRLDPSKPAYTVTGSGGGGTHTYHWSEPRALTNRERARLQTFPDSFTFSGSKEAVRKQVGMAVPPNGANVVFEAVLKTFAKINYSSIPQNM